MSAKSTAATTGANALGCVVLLAMLLVSIVFLTGGVWVAERILPWLLLLSICVFVFNVVVLVPLAVIRYTRPWAGLGFFISSYVFGLTTWLMGLLLTWVLWGGIAVVIGLLMFGIGVVPMAIIATLFRGMWAEFGLVLLGVILTFGLRTLGVGLAESKRMAPTDRVGDVDGKEDKDEEDNKGVIEGEGTDENEREKEVYEDIDGNDNDEGTEKGSNEDVLQLFFEMVQSGNIEAVQGFLKRMPRLAQLTDCDGGNALLFAVQGEHEAVLALLLSYEITQGRRNETLTEAVLVRNLKMVKMLLDRNADPNSNEDEAHGKVASERAGRTPLHEAAASNDLRVLKLLVERAADINKIDGNGRTALHYAAGNGSSEMIEFLLAKGAEIDTKTYAGETPLFLATRYVQKEASQLLLSKEAMLDDFSMIFLAVEPDAVAIINARPDLVQKKFSWDLTLLHQTATEGNIKLAQLLLELGADVNANTAREVTPLRLAEDIHGEESEIAQLIREHGGERGPDVFYD